jgi:hypothetical protein
MVVDRVSGSSGCKQSFSSKGAPVVMFETNTALLKYCKDTVNGTAVRNASSDAHYTAY